MDWELANNILAACERKIPVEERKPMFKIRPVTGGLAYEHKEYFRINNLIKQIAKNHNDTDAWTDYVVYAAYKLGLLFSADAAIAKEAFSDEPGINDMTKVYGLYVDCDTPEKVNKRSKDIYMNKMHALDAFKLYYEPFPFQMEEMRGQFWVNSNTFEMVEIIYVDCLERSKQINAYYESGIWGAGVNHIAVWREIDGNNSPYIENWVRIDHLSAEKQLGFMVARYMDLNRDPINKNHWLPSDRFEKAEDLWNEIKWYCHTNKLTLPQRPMRPGEQMSMF